MTTGTQLGSVNGREEGSPAQGTTGQVKTTSHAAMEMSKVEENDQIPEWAEGPEAVVPTVWVYAVCRIMVPKDEHALMEGGSRGHWDGTL